MEPADHQPTNSMPHPDGCLYIVATPIGNLEDITLRAIRVLGAVDVIAAEDTRHTRRLLAAHGIRNKLISYHEHNESRRTPELLQRMLQGQQVALVSDAGTPTVSDPGYPLVQAAAASAVRIVPVPGPSAAMGALSASGLPTDQFAFIGFPSRKKARRLEQIKEVASFAGTLIFYQSPRRLLAFLEELLAGLGDRRAVLARELTKVHEEFIRGPISRIRDELSLREQIKGECTILIEGQSRRAVEPDQQWEPALRAALQEETGSLGDIAKAIARQFGLKKQDVYSKALRIKKEKDKPACR